MNLSAYAVFIYRVFADAIGHLIKDDGFAMASHVALSVLMALFPFLIFIAALTGFMGLGDMADRIAGMLFDTWPERVAGPVSREITAVLTRPRGDILTLGVIVSLWFASNGVEALRTALNRAYRLNDTRFFLWLRLQSIVFVLLGSLVLIAFAFLVVLAPLFWTWALEYAPWLKDFQTSLDLSRYVIATLLTGAGLMLAHALLPYGRRHFLDMVPGVLATLVLWFVAGIGFGAYLARFANYVSTYAGLAGIMTAIIFLYLIALLFIFGGELNAAILRERGLLRERRGMITPDAAAR
ncbi:YihY/virulence factor BrkB family protein [Rhizobiales bacterium]|uniref:YihY/virulence factor BrkB family protein n=1 Tax=Hongsoonwoonella zoysiae TaxID=2821844 RepID=UPI00155F8B24|nr:YihY/virulence factor BrkB family protein [Hongsoonwoonella zoysiae]NRG17169.1 YihY/virulence factor BrkB family protein [Hongsoonwoonella zoysiae]